MPVKESLPQRPLSPYGVSKKAMIDYMVAYRELHGLEFVALALGNVYGPRQDPHGEAGVVAIFAERLLRGDDGDDLRHGEQTRDFVYVDDVVDAFVRAATARRAGHQHRDRAGALRQRALRHHGRGRWASTSRPHFAARPPGRARSLVPRRRAGRACSSAGARGPTFRDGAAAHDRSRPSRRLEPSSAEEVVLRRADDRLADGAVAEPRSRTAPHDGRRQARRPCP